MSRPLAILRPEPGWSATAAAARAQGLRVIGRPLFVARPTDWEPPAGAFDALLAGSRAVFREGGPQLADLRHLPVHAVGKATAEAARAAGFRVAMVGAGGLQQLLDSAAGVPARYLRLSGEERVRLAAHPGQTVIERVVYRLAPQPLTAAFAAQLGGAQPVIALHSAAAARRLFAETERLALPREALALLALGPRIAAAAGPGWGAVHISAKPDDAALLAKATALCK